MPSIEDFSSDNLLDDIISAALEYEGSFREAFTSYVTQAAASPELLDLLQDIADGEIIDITPGVEEVLRRINVSTDTLTDILKDAMGSVARTTVESIGLEMEFDITNPLAVDYANTMTARTITNVSAAVQESIRSVLRQVLEQDMTIGQMRQFVRNRVGLLPNHVQAVQRYYDTMIDSGTGVRRARTLADEYAQRLLSYRAEMITRTEIAAAQSYGQWAVWQQARDEDLIPLDSFRVWMTAQDERVCDVCGPMNRAVAPLDGPWMTPNGPVDVPTDVHPNCRCAMGVTFSRGRAREFLGKGPATDYDWWLLEKHLAGTAADHDQSTHGRRKQIGTSISFGPEYREWVRDRGGAGYPHNYIDEDQWESEFDNGLKYVASALKDDVARSIGAAILAEMSTSEMAEAVAAIVEQAGRHSDIGGLVDTSVSRYDIDLVSKMALLSTQTITVGDRSPHVPSALVRALEAKGLKLWFNQSYGQRDVLTSDGRLPDRDAVVTDREVMEEMARPSEWVLQQARSVLGDNHPAVQELEQSIRIWRRAGSSTPESNVITYLDRGEARPPGVLGDRALGVYPQAHALYRSTATAFTKVVGALMAEGEHNRKRAADFIISASEEAGVTINEYALRRSITLEHPKMVRPQDIGYGEPEGLANEIASRLVGSWSTSSSSPESVLMMQAAVTELGASPGYRSDDYTMGRANKPRFNELPASAQKLIKIVVRAQYDSTQEMYRDMGISEVTVARGMGFGGQLPFERVDGKMVYESQAVLRPLSSWSVDSQDAASFSEGRQILFQKVPVERIFATPFTGIGCFHESEAIFIYKDGDVFPILDLPYASTQFDDYKDLAKFINEYETPPISKAELPVIYPDADIRDADWSKRYFDFPDITTADQYRQRFGLEDKKALSAHIKEWKGTPYWEGIPSKIKTGLLKARLSKHLGSQHDQKTHGRRKALSNVYLPIEYLDAAIKIGMLRGDEFDPKEFTGDWINPVVPKILKDRLASYYSGLLEDYSDEDLARVMLDMRMTTVYDDLHWMTWSMQEAIARVKLEEEGLTGLINPMRAVVDSQVDILHSGIDLAALLEDEYGEYGATPDAVKQLITEPVDALIAFADRPAVLDLLNDTQKSELRNLASSLKEKREKFVQHVDDQFARYNHWDRRAIATSLLDIPDGPLGSTEAATIASLASLAGMRTEMKTVGLHAVLYPNPYFTFAYDPTGSGYRVSTNALDPARETDFSAIRYNVASQMIAGWAKSSSHPTSQVLMHAAVRELGASQGYSPEGYGLGKFPNVQWEELSTATQKFATDAARGQYQLTQELYAAMGVTEVTIARGMSFSGKEPYKTVNNQAIYEANAVLRPLSSWSVDVKDAKEFALGAQILFQTVPVERIFSTPLTGLGCFSESECLFIYKDGDVFPIIDQLAMPPGVELEAPELLEIINGYDMPAISKAELPTVYPDARIEDADWAKRTFDFPDVTTTKQYREKFGLQDDEVLVKHINMWKDTPYWEGIPSKIKTGLLKARLSKHLPNQHEQATHGRRKTAASYTDIPELDRVIDEFLKTKGDWTTNDCPIGEYTAADMAGACQSISEQFVGFATSRLPEGFKVYATQTNIDEMGYTPTGDPAGEIADEDGNIVPGFYYDHVVNEVYLPDRRFPITIDFSARQYGYDTQVLIQKHLPNQHDQMTHGRRKASRTYTVEDDTYITIRYGNYEGQHSPVGYLANEDSYYITELDDYYDDMPNVKRGDIDGQLGFISEYAMQRWFYYGPQSMMRTIASSMMEVGHFGSMGDEQYMDKYGDDVMDKVYAGEGPPELVDEFLLPTLSILRTSALAEPSEREWFRGMVVDTKSPILRMAVGDRFVMPPSSFGGDKEIALAFTRGGQQAPEAQMLEREEASVFNIEWRDVVFRLESGAKGTLSPDTVSRVPGGEGFPFEIVANGEFEVVSVDSPFYDYEGAEDELVEITIRHVTTFDPKTGEFVEVG